MKSKISVGDRVTLASEIATLVEATLADLKSRWRLLCTTEPPPREVPAFRLCAWLPLNRTPRCSGSA
jgi:hypothetical protein